MGLIDSELRIVVGFSGGASTMVAVRESTRQETEYGYIPKTKLVGAFTPNPKAGGLEKARNFEELDPEKQVRVIQKASDQTSLQSKLYGERIIDFFETLPNFDIFCQYGLTDFTPNNVIEWLAENNRIGINQHGACINPVPLPEESYDFGGYGMSCPERFHSARLMFVRETNRNFWQDPVAQYIGRRFDEGGVLKRGRVDIEPTDTVDSLKQRVIKVERQVQIAALSDFENGTAKVQPGYDDLVREAERPLLETVKKISRKLYGIEGEPVEKPQLDRIGIGGVLIPEDYASHLASLLIP